MRRRRVCREEAPAARRSRGKLAAGAALLAAVAIASACRREPSGAREERTAGAGAAPPAAQSPAPAAPRAAAGHAPVRLWTLTGRVVAQQSGAESRRPAARASLRVRRLDDAGKDETPFPVAGAVAAEDGGFKLEGLPGETPLLLEVDEPASALGTFRLRLDAARGDGRLDLGDIALEPPARLEVALAGPDGVAVPGAEVSVLPAPAAGAAATAPPALEEAERRALARDDGVYVLERLPPGAAVVQVRASGFAFREARLRLPRERPFRLRLEPGGKIEGSVLDPAGKPLPGAVVSALGSRPDSISLAAASGEDGRFTLDFLAPGAHTVAIAAAGHARAVFEDVSAPRAGFDVVLRREAAVAGTVVRDEDGSAVPRAWVAAALPAAAAARADADGRFELRGLAPGSVVLGAFHDGLVAAGAPLEVEAREGESLPGLALRLRRGVEARGRVLDAATREPVGGAGVVFELPSAAKGAWPSAFEEARAATTGADGAFALAGLREEEYEVSVAAPGYLRTRRESVLLDAAGAIDAPFLLERGGSISGRVVDEDGRPVAGADVELYLPNGTHEERERVRTTRARSGVDGAYEFDGLIPHLDYTVVASHGAYPLGWVFHVAVAGTTAVNGVTVELPRGGSIRGRVVDETGSVIEGASVRLEESGPGEEAKLARWRDWRLAASGEDGSYEIDRLREGRTYSLEASAPGFLPERSFSEEVEAGAATGAPDIALSRPQSMSGRVVDASGRPVPGASVNYESTDADGRFTLHNLEWTFEVRVESPGFEERTVPVATTAREVVIVLERLATLAGEVRGPAAAPLNGLRLRVAGGDGRKLETRGAGGTASWPFELAVPAGVYYVHAEAEGLARGRSAEVAVAAGERRGGIVIELEPEAIVAGKVVARATGRPVDGAAVTLQAAAAAGGRLGAMTDGAGTFELRGVPEGDVVLDVEPGAYADGTTRLAAATMPAGSVRAGERKEVAIELDPFPTGGIRGVVLEGGRPPAAAWIGKATVSLTTRGQEFLRLGVDGAGRFGIDGLEAGRYGIVVSALYDEERPDDGGRFFAQGNVNVTAGRIATARIEAGPPVEVAGRVSAGGVPASGLHLEAVDAERAFGLPDRSHGPFAWPAALSAARTDSGGLYRLRLHGGARYALLVRGEGRGWGQRELAVPPVGGTFRFDLDFPALECTGVVIDSGAGAPVEEAVVELFAGDGLPRSLLAQARARRGVAATDARGRFRIPFLAPGSYVLRATAASFPAAIVRGLRVEEGAPAKEQDVRLERGALFRLRAVDREGEEVEDYAVIVRDAGGGLVRDPFRSHGGRFYALLGSPGRPPVEDTVAYTAVVLARGQEHELVVTHPGYVPARVAVGESGEAGIVTVTLDRGETLLVRAIGPDGRLAPGATVTVVDWGGAGVTDDAAPRVDGYDLFPSPSAAFVTGEDGTAFIEHLAPGAYRVSASRLGARSEDVPVVIAGGETAEARVVLPE